MNMRLYDPQDYRPIRSWAEPAQREFCNSQHLTRPGSGELRKRDLHTEWTRKSAICEEQASETVPASSRSRNDTIAYYGLFGRLSISISGWLVSMNQCPSRPPTWTDAAHFSMSASFPNLCPHCSWSGLNSVGATGFRKIEKTRQRDVDTVIEETTASSCFWRER